MIKPAPKFYDAKKSEMEVRKWWQEADIYNKVKASREGGKVWFFMDGPPYASGAIHLGTAWNKIIKDAILRYKSMLGLNVTRQPGWDCHGLPIEVKVEEKLGIGSKKDIEKVIGVENFTEECKRWALEHVKIMTEQFERLGVWMDWDNPYITFRNEYIESAWWTLKKAFERGLFHQDLRVIHWCPRCETALAEHEVRGEYREVRDPSLYARFKLRGKNNEYLLIWTTTPWTIPADVAVCVHPEYTYARVVAGGEVYILAEALTSKVMKELGISEYKIVELIKGRDLEGVQYEHPLLNEVPKQREFTQHHRVILGEHVTLEEGTGCVHTAPGHGEEDFIVGQRYGLPVFSPVDASGRFTEEAGKYAGMFVKDADGVILEDLKRNGVLMKHGVIVHSYPHCWRCQTPLIFRATEQWFIRVSRIKPEIIEKNLAGVKWVPDWVATRYVNGVESVGDWCISRQRYWGIPLPIWRCGSCGGIKIVESSDELSALAITPLEKEDLHRPFVDRVKLRCQTCGGEMSRVQDVMDVWFDSAVASWASLGYPKKRELFEKIWPSDFITEGEDQVTKWFYAQQVASVIAFGEVPYRQVLMHGFALDEQGRKMSKSLGNVVDPQEVLDKYGADVLRFYMLSANPPWEDLRFSWKGVEVVNRTVGVLWNVYVFATTYMSLDGFDPLRVDIRKVDFLPEDRWIISRANSLIKEVSRALERFELHLATRAISSFVLEDLSRLYVRLLRERVWIEKEDPKKTAAYVALYQALHVLIRLIAPIMPHLAEVMYQGLVRAVDPSAPDSVHMLPWPTAREGEIDEELERSMEMAKSVIEAVANKRQQVGLKLRWPVKKVVIQTSSHELKKTLEGVANVLRGQTNCKELVIAGPDEPVGEYKLILVPNVQSLSKKFGELSEEIIKILRSMDVNRLKTEFDRYGFVGLHPLGLKVKVTREDVAFEGGLEQGFVEVPTEAGKVIIDIRQTPELRAESLAREVVRRLQTMRKDLDLALEEVVDASVCTDKEENLELLKTQSDYISREVRIKNLKIGKLAEAEAGYSKDWDIDGDLFRLAIRRLTA